jgi:putative ABC transport system permease protein
LTGSLTLIAISAHILPYRVVGTAKAFPGMRPNSPLMVIDRRIVLDNLPRQAQFQLWSTSSPSEVDAALKAAGIQGVATTSSADVRGIADFKILTWVLAFLQALGFMAGVIILGGLLLYLEARQRAREVSYALARRMGLGRASHRRSVILEIGGMLAVGFVLGTGLSWIASRIVYGKLDPMPNLPPPALFRVPFALLGATALAMALVAWLGSRWVQRTAERVDVAQVMRIGS